MSESKAEVKLSDIYKAFKSLQLTYGYCADVLTGYVSKGVSHKTTVTVDTKVKADLSALNDPKSGGGPICDTVPWCHLESAEYVMLVGSTAEKAAAVADSVKALIESTDIPVVEFLTGSVRE